MRQKLWHRRKSGQSANLVGQDISFEDGGWLASFACLIQLVQQAQVAGLLDAPKGLAGYLQLQGLQGSMAQGCPLCIRHTQTRHLCRQHPS